MNVVLIVSEGYPFLFSANNSKAEYIALGLKEYGCNVLMCDSILGTKGNTTLQTGVSENNIKYITLPRTGKISTVLSNIPKMWNILKKERRKKDNYVILGMTFYPIYVITAIICAILGYKRTALFHEWHIGMKHTNIINKTEAWLKDKTFGHFLNGIFPISHFLLEKGKHFNKPQMLLPIMASYDRQPTPYRDSNNFTYCGHASYILRNSLILEAFKIVISKYPIAQLTLVLFGNKQQMEEAYKLIEKTNIPTITIRYQIPQDELYKLYDTSLALLIPLDPQNLQDKARFSQKIAEYIGSKRPIITNNVGEIPYYFKNEKSALIVDYTPEAFADGMIKLIQNPEKAIQIGDEGYHTGIVNFEYKAVSFKILNFISSL